MPKAVILALVASFCTATSSVCQRMGARTAPDSDSFSPRLILHLVRQPVWLAGVGSMILGFVFQITALRFGSLALVQPILASELLFVFGYMAVIGRHVVRTDWMAAAAMGSGLGIFLFVASPSGGHDQAPAGQWWLAGVSALGLAALVASSAYVPVHRGARPSPARRAATLGVATGISWGFVAAVIKELSAPRRGGVLTVFTTWSPYVLVVVGAASVLLASHALQAGPLAASQPGFTIVDPLIASLLGVFIFSEHLQLQPYDVAVEILALAALVWGVVTLSHSRLVQSGHSYEPSTHPSVHEPVEAGLGDSSPRWGAP